MTDSDFTIEDHARLATSYGDETPEPARMGTHHLVPFNEGKISFAPDRMFDPKSYPSGGGGMSDTAGDFLRLLEALRADGGAVLTARSIDLLSTIKPGDFETFMPGWKWPLGRAGKILPRRPRHNRAVLGSGAASMAAPGSLIRRTSYPSWS
jgi:CubicO group peptidase (beta-lactamase class C family)